ncbi:MAG: hypothetical protein LBG78_06795 [Azoarcus sp.]|nr:hypothetical protein [Azoarcus sp.]
MTTLNVSKSSRYIGLELVPEYVRLAERACLRASQAASGQTLKELCGDSAKVAEQPFQFGFL